jgi:micrococcal nuclease
LAQNSKNACAMSRGRRSGIILLSLVPAAVFIALEHSPIGPKWQLCFRSAGQASAYDFNKYHAKTFTVVNVVDGDTIDIDIPDGNQSCTRVRLWGVDTPETKSEQYGIMYFAPEAAKLTDNSTLGKEVVVYLDEGNRARDKYGRLLAYVQLPDRSYLNEVLLAEGYAYADLRFRHSFYNKYIQLEAAARSLKKGLWQGVKREQMPLWLQREKPTFLLKRSK